MINRSQGLGEFQGVAMHRNYIEAIMKMGKASYLDQTLPNLNRAHNPLQVGHFDHFGPCKQASFAGHSYWCVC